MHILRLPAGIVKSSEVYVNHLIIMRLVKGFVTGVGLYYLLEASKWLLGKLKRSILRMLPTENRASLFIIFKTNDKML